ncbi:anti-phage DNA glycosylase Brig1 [Microbacterium esteraromaticum]|uniref:anti-phage DNA glycosylase Brig1 n=1 Tax=Microbacterium esteraromaticum TaxID=57043 RepID=UPI0019D3EF95|nr:hypothetical protein [Microbacterium esteraromaticum]MBN7793837.1 hypothetical protein [Microbacterium esteraromaticum]
MSALSELVGFWDGEIARWIAGDTAVSHRLQPWFRSYTGKGRGEVRLDVFPEPYTGRLIGNRSPVVMLGLNPGAAVPEFQAPGGVFFEQLCSMPYSEWAATVPYASDAWESHAGRNRFYQSRFAFARRLLSDATWPEADGVFFELYPYHSSGVTAAMTPPADVLREFVLDPIGELDTQYVFAFGKPWFSVPARLGLRAGHELDVEWSVSSRRAQIFALPSGQDLVVMAQSGYAGPPGDADTEALARALGLR